MRRLSHSHFRIDQVASGEAPRDPLTPQEAVLLKQRLHDWQKLEADIPAPHLLPQSHSAVDRLLMALDRLPFSPMQFVASAVVTASVIVGSVYFTGDWDDSLLSPVPWKKLSLAVPSATQSADLSSRSELVVVRKGEQLRFTNTAVLKVGDQLKVSIQYPKAPAAHVMVFYDEAGELNKLFPLEGQNSEAVILAPDWTAPVPLLVTRLTQLSHLYVVVAEKPFTLTAPQEFLKQAKENFIKIKNKDAFLEVHHFRLIH